MKKIIKNKKDLCDYINPVWEKNNTAGKSGNNFNHFLTDRQKT